jgi:hypothetical protein
VEGSTFRAAGKGGYGIVAVMTMERLVGEVVDQGDAAIGTLVDEATVSAEGESGKATPVQKKKGRFVPFDIPPQSFFQDPGKNGSLFSLPLLLAHIDYLNFREGAKIDAAGKGEVMKFLLLGIVIRFHGGSRRAEYRYGLLHLTPDEGQITGVVTHFFFLLIRRVMFFIYDDDAQLIQGSEDRRASPEDQLHQSPFYSPPLIITLPRG